MPWEDTIGGYAEEESQSEECDGTGTAVESIHGAVRTEGIEYIEAGERLG